MTTLTDTAKQIETSYTDIDILLDRAIKDNMPTDEVIRQLTEIADARWEPLAKVRVHFQLRFMLCNQRGVYDAENLAKASPALRRFLGLNSEP